MVRLPDGFTPYKRNDAERYKRLGVDLVPSPGHYFSRLGSAYRPGRYEEAIAAYTNEVSSLGRGKTFPFSNPASYGYFCWQQSYTYLPLASI